MGKYNRNRWYDEVFEGKKKSLGCDKGKWHKEKQKGNYKLQEK